MWQVSTAMMKRMRSVSMSISARCGSCRRRQFSVTLATAVACRSAFSGTTEDSLAGIVDLWNENVWLASRGGGIGSYWGNLRALGEKVGRNGKTSGVVPFIRVQDSLTLAISQGSLRRGSSAVYLDISHPEIEEFLDLRRPTGGDPNRKALNLHHGVAVTDAFMEAVEKDEKWDCFRRKTNSMVETVKARPLGETHRHTYETVSPIFFSSIR